MVPPPSTRREGRFFAVFFGLWVVGMAQNPDELRKLGQRLDEAQQRRAVRPQGPPPTQLGIAGRFSTELVASLVVGGGLGWGIDWLFGHFGIHTRPVFMIVCVVLGAVAGIRNVMRAATEINAQLSPGDKEK
jgi:ATP synthase protein I